jgi:hypothetical protein
VQDRILTLVVVRIVCKKERHGNVVLNLTVPKKRNGLVWFMVTHKFCLCFYMKYSIGHFEILTSLLQKVSRIFDGIHCKKNCVN